MIEEPRTNYLIHSQDFQNWNSNINVVSRNKELSIADPSGGFTSNRIVANTSWSVYRDQVANGAVPNGVHSVSIFARAVTGGFNILTLTGSSVNVRVNLELGTVLQSSGTTGTALVTPFGPIGADGFRWYRISYVPVDTTYEAIYLESAAFTGTRDICLVWGAQFEVGAFATSYIPTIPAEAARSADVCSIIGDAFSSFYNQSEGTLFAECEIPSANQRAGIAVIGGISFNDNIALFKSDSTGGTLGDRFVPYVTQAGVLVALHDFGTGTGNGLMKVAASVALNNMIFARNGTISPADLTAAMPTPNRLTIGARADGNYINGHIDRITYFRKRLSNAKLQTLTAP